MDINFLLELGGVLVVVGIALSLLASFTVSKGDSLEKRIENLLPSINCGQCGFPGCEAYAKALAKGECAPNLCKPAGADVGKQLADLVGVSAERSDDYEEQLFSPRLVAYIHENTCTGCGNVSVNAQLMLSLVC